MIENVSKSNEFKADPKWSLIYFNSNCFLEILKNQIIVTEEKICETMIQCSKINSEIIKLTFSWTDLNFLKKEKKQKRKQENEQEIENESQIRINKKIKITQKKKKTH